MRSGRSLVQVRLSSIADVAAGETPAGAWVQAGMPADAWRLAACSRRPNSSLSISNGTCRSYCRSISGVWPSASADSLCASFV